MRFFKVPRSTLKNHQKLEQNEEKSHSICVQNITKWHFLKLKNKTKYHIKFEYKNELPIARTNLFSGFFRMKPNSMKVKAMSCGCILVSEKFKKNYN